MRTTKVKEIESSLDLVRQILEKYPEARDNSTWLLILFWNSQTHGRLFWNIEDIKERIFSKRLTAAESVTRAKRLLQAAKPELRGNKEERIEIAEEVRRDIPRSGELF